MNVRATRYLAIAGEQNQRSDGDAGVICPMHEVELCRSCPVMSMPIRAQLLAKQEAVSAMLPMIDAERWHPPVASAPNRFRNKAKMAVSGSAEAPLLGLAARDGSGVDLRTCPLHVLEIEEALPAVARAITRLGLEPYSIAQRRGELKHVLLTASPDGDLMLRWVLRSTERLEDLRADLPQLQEALPQLAVVSANIQPVHQAIIEGPEEHLLSEETSLLMRLQVEVDGAMRELPLYVPTRSFFQTNTGVAEKLYATAASWLSQTSDAEQQVPAHTSSLARPGLGALKPIVSPAPNCAHASSPEARTSQGFAAPSAQPMIIWDLFCGVGGFALALAGPGRRVIGVELSESAIHGAQASATLMGLRDEQAHFEAGDARSLDPAHAAHLPRPDVLVVNPPRRGIGELAQAIEQAAVPRVLYSSCNPASLARDLEAMPSYRAGQAQLFDMFPHTQHAEVLVELERVPSLDTAESKGIS